MRVAVIGGGISGISAAYKLSQNHQVTIFEAGNYLGGHTNTIVLEKGVDKGLSVDTGFIVCNPENYPNFYRFLNQLGVELRDCEMSFGYFSDEQNLYYSGPTIQNYLRIPKNIFNLKLVQMVFEQRRFNKDLIKKIENKDNLDITVAEFISKNNYSSYFLENCLLPLIAAVWSAPDTDALEFPLSTFANFFHNHGMLDLSKLPQWQTVRGGSFAYIQAFQRKFKGTIYLNRSVSHLERSSNQVKVFVDNSDPEIFDAVIFATHADTSLSILKDPTEEERKILGNWRYTKNKTVLHTDETILPLSSSQWSSWNYVKSRESSNQLSITYYMNLLQGLSSDSNYLVTLNPNKEIDPDKIIYQTIYTHPVYSPSTKNNQAELKSINGLNNTYYCGAYMGYGFHEDGFLSGLEAANLFEKSV